MKTRTILALTALVLPVVGAHAELKTVALQGQQTPQMSGFALGKFKDPVVCDAVGQRVAVYNTARGRNRCIFKFDPDTPLDGTVACERTPSPDAGRTFARFGDPTINAAADVAWYSREDFGSNGAFQDTTLGNPTVVALLGTTVPGLPSGTLKELTFARITDSQGVFFESTISGAPAPITQGLFRCSGGDGNCSGGSGTLETVLLVNDAVTDRPGREFCEFGALAASDYGIAFRAETKLDCTMNSETALEGVFRKAIGGNVETLALSGEASEPFLAPGGTMYALPQREPAIENGGSVAFVSTTFGVLNTFVVYLCDQAVCPGLPATAIARVGDTAPTTVPLNERESLRAFSRPAISAAKDVAFSAKVDPPGGFIGYGVFVRRFADGSIERLARSGEEVPNMSPISLFKLHMNPPSMSAGGRVAFKSRIRRSVFPRNLEGIFLVEGSPSGAFLDPID